MTRPVAKLLDNVACFVPCSNGVIQSVFQIKTFVNNRPVARVGDLCSNCCFGSNPACGCPNPIITGLPRTFVGNKPVATLGSLVIKGIVTNGSFNTFIGG